MSRVTIDARMLRMSGIGRYLSELVPRLMTRLEADFRILGDAEELRDESAGWPRARGVDLVPCNASIYSLAEQRELPRCIGRDTDLFWAPHYNFPLRHRGRMVVTVHDLIHVACPQFVQGVHRRVYARFMFRMLARRADAIVCVSEYTAAELARYTGVDRRRLRVIHNGVAPAWFDADVGERPVEGPYMLYVGNVKPHKNLKRLVEAFTLLSERVPHQLVIVGKRAGFITGDAEVESAAARLGGRVRFTGAVDDSMLRRYMGHADALVFPSLYEGFGLPPLEAMASGCPVLVSNATCLPEICGDAAHYCDATDPLDIARQMERLAESPGLREELVGRGRERARRFSWDRSADQLAEVMSALLPA